MKENYFKEFDSKPMRLLKFVTPSEVNNILVPLINLILTIGLALKPLNIYLKKELSVFLILLLKYKR